MRVMRPNPLLDKITKLVGLSQQILSLRFGSGVRAVVIDLVSLATASIKIRHQRRYGLSHSDFQRLKSRQVVPRACDAVAGARDHYFRQLECGIVRGRKSPVGRQRLDAGILQVTINDVPQIVEFLLAGPVRPYPLRLQ